MIQIGSSTIFGTNASGTFIGINTSSSYLGDYINIELASRTLFSVLAGGMASTSESRTPSSTIGTGIFTTASATTANALNGSTTRISALDYGLFPSLFFTNGSGTNLTASGYLQSQNVFDLNGNKYVTSTSGGITNTALNGQLMFANLAANAPGTTWFAVSTSTRVLSVSSSSLTN